MHSLLLGHETFSHKDCPYPADKLDSQVAETRVRCIFYCSQALVEEVYKRDEEFQDIGLGDRAVARRLCE